MVVLVVADPLRGAGGFCVCSCKKGVRVCFDWACFFGELFWVKQVWEVFCSGSCEETVGADTTGPARGKGRFGYWAYGIPCGYMSGDLLLTFQVPQGNLETMMRILINSAGGWRYQAARSARARSPPRPLPRTGRADEADDGDVVTWSPGQNVARPTWRPAVGAGGSNDPLPPRVQPEGPLAVVPQVAEGPHAYVGAALRMVANSPPSRAFTRLRASMRQLP